MSNYTVREALIKLRAFAKSLDCDYQEECTPGEDDMCESCKHVYIADQALAAISAIDLKKEKWRIVLEKMLDAMERYEMDTDEPAPYRHRKMMQEARDILSSESPQDDGKPEVISISGANTLDELIGLMEIARANKTGITLDWVEVGIILRAADIVTLKAQRDGLLAALQMALADHMTESYLHPLRDGTVEAIRCAIASTEKPPCA